MADNKDNSYWFTHDCDASSDPKIVALMVKYDWAGYGRWWRLLEAFRMCEGYRYNISSKFSYPGLATILKYTVDECKQFINDCIEEFELLKTDGDYIWSESFNVRMEKWDRKKAVLSERGRKGAEVTNAKKAASAGESQSGSEVSEKVEPTVEEQAAKDLLKKYSALEKTKAGVIKFINDHKPAFVEPYVDIWNIWAGEREKPKVTVITPKRRQHFNARIKEKSFIFIDILTRATKSEFLLKSDWFTFDWIMKSKDNYVKLMEGHYDKKAIDTPAAETGTTNKAEEKLEQLVKGRRNG